MFTHSIAAQRLELRQMAAEFLDASCDDSLKGRCLGFAVHPEWCEAREFIELRRGQYHTDPRYPEWGVWAIVDRDTRQMIGHIGFHSPPDPEYLRPYVSDAVEFGYSIYPEFRSQGFATEAARALVDWAAREKHQRRFVMSISPTNDHSLAIARKLGFAQIAEWEDDVDGTELVFLLEVPDARNSPGGVTRS